MRRSNGSHQCEYPKHRVRRPARRGSKRRIPGRVYPLTLKITVKDSDGDLEVLDYNHVRTEQIQWTATSLTFGGRTMTVARNNLQNWQTGYTVQVKIPGNSFHAVTRSFSTNWLAFNELSYYGSYVDDNRRAGGRGPDLIVNSARIESTSSVKWRLLRVQSSLQETLDWIVVPEANAFALKSVGADGAPGSSGARFVYDSKSHSDVLTCPEGSSGTSGADGGNGGNIVLGYYSEDSQFGFRVQSLGGSGGEGGDGCLYGQNGSRGQPGAPGSTTIEHPSRAQVEALSNGVDLNGLSIID